MQIKTKIVSTHTADSKPVKQEVNGTVILPPLVFPGQAYKNIELTRKSLIELSAGTNVLVYLLRVAKKEFLIRSRTFLGP